jgi:hypothetical protein
MAAVTVAVGWTDQRPVVPDQYVSCVTVPLAIADTADDGAVRLAALRATLAAFEAVTARSKAGRWPKVEMITSLNIMEMIL